MVDLDLDEIKLDIHHIFPRKWCEDNAIPARVFNAIVNKTAISYKANRMIGGKAPHLYLAQIQTHAQVQLADPGMDTILKTHLIEPTLLRADSFENFYAARKTALLSLVERAMGKAPGEALPMDDDEDEGDDESEVAA
jgi:hypothetical protein